MRPASILAAAAFLIVQTAGADGWSLSIGAHGSVGDSLSSTVGSTTLSREVSKGPWTLAAQLGWDAGWERPADSLWNAFYPELSVALALGEHASLSLDAWAEPLADKFDGGGSSELSAWVQATSWLRLSGKAGAGWSRSALWNAWSTAQVRVSPDSSLHTFLSATVEYERPSLSLEGGGKTENMYVPVFSLRTGFDWTLGPVTTGPDLGWSWYSLDRTGGGKGSSSSGTKGRSTSASGENWSAGAHGTWEIADFVDLDLQGAWTWSDQTVTTTGGAKGGSTKNGTSPAGNASTTSGLSWSATTTWWW